MSKDEAVTVYREDDFHEDGSPGWWSVAESEFIPANWREGRWLPAPAYSALLRRVEAAEGALLRMVNATASIHDEDAAGGMCDDDDPCDLAVALMAARAALDRSGT